MRKSFQHDDVPPVQTESGLLHGYRYDNMYIFKGVPYAQAGRFKMPRPVTPWEGVRQATAYGFVCPLMEQDTPGAELMVPHRYWPMSEHCQNLNIWTDSLDRAAKRPVMVWLHGGAFVAGSSIEQVAYDGFNLCRRGDVVVVSVNHRLNILGYLDLSPFGEQYANSANLGHADLVAALRWIHDNIESFGGDPGNVTLFGQSGGGMKITGLMGIEAANGLFHRAVIMSGVLDGRLIEEPHGDGRAVAEAMLAELGLCSGEVLKLESIPYPLLLSAYNKAVAALPAEVCYVGCVPMPNDYFRGEPLLHGFSEHAKTIPLMIGTVFGEFDFSPLPFDKGKLGHDQMLCLLCERLGEHAEELARLFAGAYPSKNLMDLLSLDRVFRAPSKALAKLHAEGGGAPAYLYNFILDFPIHHNKPAWHCSDIPFFFGNTELVELCEIEHVTERLEQQVMNAVVSFAYSGNPNHDLLPRWDRVTLGCETTMIFDRECRVGINYDDELLRRMEEVLPTGNLAELIGEDVQH